ncbi:3-deoxy-D-manno-octulosonic acid kinase [Vibrio sp. A11]|uniref:3-deoxy-D-manno-octulosonic acid kinase n=1 Tax=Vibrio sp. A11 TaxID=2591464 RepID=UPI001483A0D1|nr:3-deoxy-D-manno-octulosonic acid kinase [Vibrio sp. A11]NNN61232.1 3-deoxy-D-manno-octulosonic acid kinase [Vibrio sp. A11]
MIKQCSLKQQMIWYDDQWVSEPLHDLFDVAYWHAEQKIIGSAKGRGTTWFVAMQHIEAALRHYRRGGLFGKVVSDQYWFQGWHKTRSYAEFHLLAHLRQQGVNVPRPIAARAVKRGLVYQADLLSEKITNARDLVAILQENPLDERHYFLIGQQIAKLHRAQVNHTDLNIHNILIDDQDKVWIIDFDKCHQQPGEHWKEANLQRLLRSFHKEQQRCGIFWQELQWQHIVAGYEDKD